MGYICQSNSSLLQTVARTSYCLDWRLGKKLDKNFPLWLSVLVATTGSIEVSEADEGQNSNWIVQAVYHFQRW